MKLKYLLFVAVGFVGLMTSCGGDSIDCSDEMALEEATTAGLEDVTDAFTKFSTDPSESNCQEVRNALSNWINDIEDLEDCARERGELAEFQEALNEAREQLNDFPC